MKIRLSFAGIALLSAAVAGAQETPAVPKAETGFNYSFTRISRGSSTPSFNANGGSGYAAYNVNRVLGVVVDMGAYHNGNAANQDATMFTYLFGPRFNWRMSRVTPYAQALAGGARVWTSMDDPATGLSTRSGQNGFAAAFGGGFDIALTDHLSVKPFQMEYLMTKAEGVFNNNNLQNNMRYSAGVVFRFGRK